VITLDWTVPSNSVAEAKLNHRKCALLFSMLYPNYEDAPSSGRTSATQITTAPLFKVKLGNLIQDPTAGSGTVEDAGLVGVIEGFLYTPDLEEGMIDDIGGASPESGPFPIAGGYGNLYPKAVKLAMEFKVLHTHGLGWQGTEKREKQFPYGDTPALQDPAGDTTSSSNMDEVSESNEAQALGE
jgi:hypothetical protein